MLLYEIKINPYITLNIIFQPYNDIGIGIILNIRFFKKKFFH